MQIAMKRLPDCGFLCVCSVCILVFKGKADERGRNTGSVGKRLLEEKNCLENSKERGGERILLGKEHYYITSLEVWEIHYAELQTMFASSKSA